MPNIDPKDESKFDPATALALADEMEVDDVHTALERLMCFPVPEALPGKKGDGWQIAPNIKPGEMPMEACTIKEKRRMIVPFTDTEQAHCIRLHEMAHAKYSPARKSKTFQEIMYEVPDTIYQRVEDARMHFLLKHHAGSPMGAIDAPETPEELATDYVAIVEKEAARRGRTPEEREQAIMLATCLLGLDLVGRMYTESFYPMMRRLKDIELLKRGRGSGKRRTLLLMAQSLIALHFEYFRRCYDGTGRTSPQVGHLDTAKLSRDIWKEMRKYAGPSRRGNVPMYVDTAISDSGRMIVQEPPRPIRTDVITRERDTSYADFGTVFRAAHRYCTDQKVFTMTRKRNQGGSVLIDCSGSMNYHQKEVKVCQVLVPALLVATYSGSAYQGHLRIICKDGWRVEDEMMGRPSGGGNVIDVPALLWLGQQPEPRLWISDGGVTGMGEANQMNIRRAAAAICKRYRIEQVRGIDQLRTWILKTDWFRPEHRKDNIRLSKQLDGWAKDNEELPDIGNEC